MGKFAMVSFFEGVSTHTAHERGGCHNVHAHLLTFMPAHHTKPWRSSKALVAVVTMGETTAKHLHNARTKSLANPMAPP